MTGPVHAEVPAVHELARAVSRFAQQVHDASRRAWADAQREAARLQEIVEQRRQALRQANQKLAEAQAALNECLGVRVLNCSSLFAAVVAAQAAQESAESDYHHAVAAANTAASAARDLSAAVATVEAAVAGPSSAAVAALRDLEHRLHRVGDFIGKWVTGAIVALSALGVGHAGITVTQQFIDARNRETVAQYYANWEANRVDLGLAAEGRRIEQLNDDKDRAIQGDQWP